MENFTLTEIWVYPIKSLRGISLDMSPVFRKGLRYDRRWMLIDGNGVAMTQRSYPQMALFQPVIDDGVMHIHYRKEGRVVSTAKLNVTARQDGKEIPAQIWDDEVTVTEVDHSLSEWFSNHLRISCRLVSFAETSPRPVNPKYSVADDHVSLADAYPCLMIGQSSLDDLNHRLEQPVPMNRFRPNLVFRGGDAFAEDEWKQIRIGEVSFAAVKRCDRCSLPTVDQETAVRGSEPMRTLSTYRKTDGKVYFGQNLIPLVTGIVKVGDTIIPQ